MVYLSRIYTKTGDQGETGLGDGTRVPKDDPRVAAYGDTDELNAVLGLLVCQSGVLDAETKQHLHRIQNDLFDLGADLCVPMSAHEKPGQHLRMRASQSEQLEKEIDRLNAKLEPLRSFVVPGGTATAAWCHLARTVCRRAERSVVTLARRTAINPQIIIYLNRLSDYLFVLARASNAVKGDVLWVPGGVDQPSK
jgi:cob(I)alamin adenosyltransferase